jgi:hypothetical protein
MYSNMGDGRKVMRKSLFFIYITLIGISCLVGDADNLSASPDPEGRVVWELIRTQDFDGPIQRGTVDAEGRIAYLATRGKLYQIQTRDGRPIVRTIAEKPKKGPDQDMMKKAHLALAPSGGVYAWMIPHPFGRGLFFVRLFDLSENQIGELKLKDFPYGFGALYFGFQGKIIVTTSPLDDWQGIRGRFQFTFWGKDGTVLNKERVILDGRHMAILDPAGESILLLGNNSAKAYNVSGDKLWEHQGNFRKGAIAQKGYLALLNPNPSEKIRQLVIVKKNPLEPPEVSLVTTSIIFLSPVHGLTLTPDGSSAAIIGDEGYYSYLDISDGKLKEVKKPLLPETGSSYYIFNSKFVNANSLALGIQRRIGKPPQATWKDCKIIIVDREGNTLFEKEYPLREAISSIPGIDVTFDNHFLVGFTQDTAVLVELKD